MKRLVILILLLAIVLFLGIVVFPKRNNNIPTLPSKVPITPTTSIVTPSTSVTPLTPQQAFCITKDLEATMITEGAAGNIYGTLTIKNTSSHTCAILGDGFIAATFSAPNLIISHQGSKGPAKIQLSPQQIVYSQIHYPNGPQCSGSIKQVPVTFSYTISPNTSVSFGSAGNLPSNTVTTCSAINEMTQLDVWGISLQTLH